MSYSALQNSLWTYQICKLKSVSVQTIDKETHCGWHKTVYVFDAAIQPSSLCWGMHSQFKTVAKSCAYNQVIQHSNTDLDYLEWKDGVVLMLEDKVYLVQLDAQWYFA